MSKNVLHFILLFSFLSVCLFSCGEKREKENEEKEKSGITVIETGELAAENVRAFVLPRYGRYWSEMRITGILDHGTIVQAGDSIIEVDGSEIKRFIIEKESELETEMASLQKLIVNQDNTLNEFESNIKTQIASFNLKKIELEASVFESPRARRIKELEFKQAEITLEKEKKKLEYNKIILANDYRIQEIRVERIVREIQSAYDILPSLTIRTPLSGVFQIAWNWRTESLVKVGDNLYAGNRIANVPELTWMKVKTYINETDFLKIKEGQKVAVRLDASPELVFDGEITYIGKACFPRERNSRQKVFDVEVKILQSDERLKPGMTVSCEFLES
ncbi:MAG: efflux RND transporter periplasmic adaptor subunit [Odoribacter sp.]|nr:efflux RND transporter periplasmic adaptor subunit [Odoribacter sp.]